MSDLTCKYEPTAYYNYWDEDDVEHITTWADDDATECYTCSNCHSSMLREWFKERIVEEHPFAVTFKPLFNFCPYCGAKVVQQ